ncbi:glycoside hydrolase family 3 N-terminal domain-containing protein [Lentisphaerota bacterium WC36G]|nr:glycoside hydrolase family 3 C-terminal domain-containing protein [Lentisphaerae bacterium WC36]
MKNIKKIATSVLMVSLTISALKAKDSYFNKNLSAEKRAILLLNKMTLAEKIGQMCQYTAEISNGKTAGLDDLTVTLRETSLNNYRKGIEPKAKLIRAGKIGSFLKVPGVTAANYLQSQAMKTRLKIPLLIATDAIHGHGMFTSPATIFPTPMTLASTFSEELAEKMARATALEMRATGYQWTFSPNLDIVRDQRWGRTGETFGEDTLLVTKLSVAMIRGYQGKNINENSVLACAKHLVGGGESLNGINGAESDISLHTLNSIYYPPFIKAFEANCFTAMAAHNAINGVPCHSHHQLLTQLAKRKWGLKGFIVSDWNDIRNLASRQKTAKNFKEASMQAINAGIDIHMQGNGFFDNMIQLVKENKVSEERINEAVKPILIAKFKLGLFENPYVKLEKVNQKVLTDKHRNLALEIARQGIVLLKNNHQLLPLKNLENKKVLLCGFSADNQVQLGDWAKPQPDENVVTIYEGLKKELPHSTNLELLKVNLLKNINNQYIEKAVKQAQKADYVIVIAGENSLRHSREKTAGENVDRSSLQLPGKQLELIKKLKTHNPNIIVCLINSRALAINWCSKNIDAILECWEPGLLGGQAVAEIITGKVNPSGKLAISFPRSAGHLQIHYNRKPMRIRNYADSPDSALYDFGHGLSYSKFNYSNLKVSSINNSIHDNLEVAVTVKNDGNIAGDEVILIYCNDVISSTTTPIKKLVAFKRVHFKPFETKIVNLTIENEQLSLFTLHNKQLVEAGEFIIMVNSLQKNISLK